MQKSPVNTDKVLHVSNTPEEHQQRSVKKQISISLLILLLLVGVTTILILYGKGYRLFLQHGEPAISKTGILNLSSNPTGAQIFIDGHLTAATNTSINLTPGIYSITITKDGYLDWKKNFQIKKEVVSNAVATLFPKAPSLQSISTFGIKSAILDPTGTKLAFNIASRSALKNGIYVYDMTSRSFPILAGQSSTTQIVNDTIDTFSEAKIAWSPDGTQIIASISAPLNNAPTYYLLNATAMNQTPQDVTAIYPTILAQWQQQRTDKEEAQIKSLKPAIQKFAAHYFNILSWSPDGNKILYQASQSAQMPIFIKPRIIGNNNLYERRDLKKGGIYVYNITEDFNTRILAPMKKICTINDPSCNCDEFTNCPLPLTWFPDSRHLLYVHDKKINVVEDDGSNMTTLYAGPFVNHYVFPWPDGSKLVILTNLENPDIPPTLYSIGLQ